MPLKIPAPSMVLEGDYSTWTIYDSFDDLDASYSAGYGQFGVVNREETKIIMMDLYNYKIKMYDIATKTLTDLGFTNPIGIEQAAQAYWSAYRTYEVVVDDYNQLKVIKNGTVIKTFSYTDLGFTSPPKIKTASISPKGKYIVISGQRSATGNPGWVVLVAS
jgi:hypothetical protein